MYVSITLIVKLQELSRTVIGVTHMQTQSWTQGDQYFLKPYVQHSKLSRLNKGQ